MKRTTDHFKLDFRFSRLQTKIEKRTSSSIFVLKVLNEHKTKIELWSVPLTPNLSIVSHCYPGSNPSRSMWEFAIDMGLGGGFRRVCR